MQQRRYSFVPVLAIILQVLAIIFFALFMYQSVQGFIETAQSWKGGPGMYGQMMPATTKMSEKLLSLMRPLSSLFFGLLIPLLVWGAGSMLSILRDIEFNTRVQSGVKSVPAIETAPVAEAVNAE